MIRTSILTLYFGTFLILTSHSALAAGKYEINPRDPKPNNVAHECSGICRCVCEGVIQSNHKKIRAHMTDEFIKHRDWMIDELFTQHVLPAMAHMTVQLQTVAMTHTYAIGKFFDAKHQLETQTIFQKLMAEANKDYMPSKGICTIGTSTRSLAQSSRKGDLAHVAFANRVLKRQLLNKDILSAGDESDVKSRIDLLANKHCNVKDNGNGLNRLCQSSGPIDRRNKDVDFTRLIDSKLTIDADFYKEEAGNVTPDEEDVFALTSHLFSSSLNGPTPRSILANKDGVPRDNAYKYLNLRSVLAKRSVAQNSISAIVAEKSNGDPEVAKFLKRIVTDLGVTDPEDVEKILGKNPSYFAQMEVLTKDIYQNPAFYTELYDKPANVLRKSAMIRALSLMQERDLYRSQLRNEATLAVILETMLHDEQTKISGRLGTATPRGN